MIQTLTGIDLHASAGTTLWHRASALSKLALAALLVALAIVSPGLALLGAVHALAWGLAISSRVAPRLLLAAALYPLWIAGLFALAAWDGTWTTPLRIALRPLTASLAAVWLVAATPYPDLMAPLSRILPRGAGDGLFVTYRALFGLLARVERLGRALRMRGAAAVPPRQRLRLAGHGLGTLVLHGFERSQRLVATMRLRGHAGRICGCRHWAETGRADLPVAALAAVAAAAAAALWGR